MQSEDVHIIVKIIYSKHFKARYHANPVENPDRAGLPAQALLEAGYEFVEPSPASEEDIRKVHGLQHIELVRSNGLYDAVALSAGGAIATAQLAVQGEPAFALVRPPGHQALSQPGLGDVFFTTWPLL
jgi:acetoin utilization deacetylase AcuC-like enzyme